MEITKEEILKLLKFIDAEARKVDAYEYGIPLYDREEELIVYKVQEFLKALEDK